MKEGKLFGHRISQKGIMIDPKRIKAIIKIELPRNKEKVQSFLRKVNLLKIFIAVFAKIVNYITNMLGKDQEIRWTPESIQSFEGIKRSIAEEPILASPYFSKYLLIFSFSSKHKVAIVLLQKNHEGYEHPIVFYKNTLRDAPLKYNILDKKSYALV